ncbi:unnamed protein product, partial [Prorocentrum cordatum]
PAAARAHRAGPRRAARRPRGRLAPPPARRWAAGGAVPARAEMSSSVAGDEVTRLWRVRKTVFQMLRDREYQVPQKLLEESKDREFESAWKQASEEGCGREKFIILVYKKGNPAQQLIVFFPEDFENKRVGVKPIRILAEKMDEKGIREAILVVRQPLTPLAQTAIKEAMSKMRIEVFAESELIVNITHHELVPKHQPLTDEDRKQQLLQRYRMRPTQLPRVQLSDPGGPDPAVLWDAERRRGQDHPAL